MDQIYSSTLKRAFETALSISENNIGKPEVLQNEALVERENGPLVQKLLSEGKRYEAKEELFGPGNDRNFDHRPQGGESFKDVSTRAGIVLRTLLNKHAVHLKEHGEHFDIDPDEDITVTLAEPFVIPVPEGIPYIVIVSHNVFLIMLHEEMLSWKRPRCGTSFDYGYADLYVSRLLKLPVYTKLYL
jgi:hypothetical protein